MVSSYSSFTTNEGIRGFDGEWLPELITDGPINAVLVGVCMTFFRSKLYLEGPSRRLLANCPGVLVLERYKEI